MATSFVGALLGMIEEWLDGSIEADPPTLTRWFIRQQMAGLEWALGFGPGEITAAGAVAAEEQLPSAS